MTSPDTADLPQHDKTATALLIAVGLTAAVVTGAALAGSAGGVKGFARNAAIETEQRQQAAAIARIDQALGAVIGDVATITSRSESAHDDAVHERLARLDADVGELRMTLFVASAAERLRDDSWRERAAELDADLARNGIEIAALRTSIDGRQPDKALAGIARRVDRLEALLVTGDVTGSLPAAKPRPARAKHGQKHVLRAWPLRGWSVTHGEPGFAIVAGADATFDAAPGRIIPGLGRVTAVRRTHNGWVVVTEKGTIAAR